MKQPAKGRIHERITAIATASYPAYIVRGDEQHLMIDAGLNLLGPRYLASIEDMLRKGGQLDCLFLTHSHYDHVGSAGYLKRHLPGLKIGAHERVAGLVRKPSVLETMNRLSMDHAEFLKQGSADEDLTVQPFDIDIILKQGDEFDLGGLTCRVYETPGHTRDSLAFYFPEIRAMFPGDACGVLRADRENGLQVEFVASYQDYVDSLRLMTALEPEIVCLAHNWVLTHKEAAEFLERSLAETFQYRELIESHLKAANGNVEQAIQDMTRAEHDASDSTLEPSAGHLANLAAQVRHIAELRTDASLE